MWVGLVHDWKKFRPRDWMAYVRQFYLEDGTRINVRDVTGSYDARAQTREFNYAWLDHQKSGHHWQAWVLIGDGGVLSAVKIPDRYLREMVADWIGAGKTQGNGAREWYQKNKDKMVLHPDTRRKLEVFLDMYAD